MLFFSHSTNAIIMKKYIATIFDYNTGQTIQWSVSEATHNKLKDCTEIKLQTLSMGEITIIKENGYLVIPKY
jgi:hypothetical protein